MQHLSSCGPARASVARARAAPARRVTALAALAAIAAITGGCARAETNADRHIEEMQESISKMQAEHDRMDQRLGALEIAVADEKTARAPKSAPPAAPTPARVVQLGDTGPSASEDPEDASERPEIKVIGSGGSVRTTRGKSASDDRGDARPSALDPDAKRSYDKALRLVHDKKYDEALDALAGFMVRWPDHPYAENALYWRGETYFAKGDYARANEQFEAVLGRFSGGKKAPDALLKIGMCQERLGATERAREAWDRLKREFPRSEAARKIPAPRATHEDRSPKGPKESR